MCGPPAPLAGSHAIFVERCAVLEGVKVDAIAKATSQRDFQLQSVAKLFEYQKHASECICEVRARARALPWRQHARPTAAP